MFSTIFGKVNITKVTDQNQGGFLFIELLIILHILRYFIYMKSKVYIHWSIILLFLLSNKMI